MAYNILGVDTGASGGVLVEPVNRATYVLIDTVAKADGTREAVYQKVGASLNPDYPTQVRAGYYPKAASANISVKFSTFVENTATTPSIFEPFSATLALSGPKGALGEAEIVDLLCNLVNWILPVSSGEFQTTKLAELKFGIVSTLLS